MTTNTPILIAGGYGVVGSQIARIIRQRHPSLPLLIAGRNPAQAAALVSELGHAEALALDVTQPNPLKGLRPQAVLGAVNDPQDHLILDAAQNGIPVMDITRWTSHVRSVADRLHKETLRAPALLASGWMAGSIATLALALTQRLQSAREIHISILYALKDKSGPNSVEYMDRLEKPFPSRINGQDTLVNPCTDPRVVRFPGGLRATTYRLDTPDQFTLPGATGAQTVAARIAFDDAWATGGLVFVVRSGLWKLFSGDAFTSLRRSILHSSGPGAAHEVVIEVHGADETGRPQTLRADLRDPLGQTHCTAVGAVIQLEHLLTLPPGLYYPESQPNLPVALQTLAEQGIHIKMTEESIANLPIAAPRQQVSHAKL